MTTVLTRIGQWEIRRAVHYSIQTSPKRWKQGEWLCVDCKARQASRQPTRQYSVDGNPPLPARGVLPHSKDQDETVPRNVAQDGEDAGQRPSWGLSWFREQVPPASDQDRNSTTVPRSGSKEYLQGNQFSLEHLPRVPQLWDSNSEGIAEDTEALSTDSADVEENVWHESVRAGTTAKSQKVRGDGPTRDLDFQEALADALSRQDSESAIQCLSAAIADDDLGFIPSMPSITFSEVLRLLSRSKFLTQLPSVYRGLGWKKVRRLRISTAEEIGEDFLRMISQVIGARQSNGSKLNLGDYTDLLYVARFLRRWDFAEQVWHSLIKEGHIPNTACYNHYMSSLAWDRLYYPEGVPRAKATLLGRRQGRDIYTHGLHRQMTEIFDGMLNNQVSPDEATFCNLIISAGRAGDLSAVQTILKDVWKIDVEAILAGRARTSPPSEFTQSLQPTSNLLFALAHAFGINGGLLDALRLVDFVSKQYNVEINAEVWRQLFEMAYYRMQRRVWHSRERGRQLVQMRSTSALSVWQTMTGPPYSVRPDMTMYHQLIRNLAHEILPLSMVEKMEEGRRQHEGTVELAETAFANLEAAIQDPSEQASKDQVPSLQSLRDDWERLHILSRRNGFYLRNWVRELLLSSHKFSFDDHFPGFATERLPRMLWIWHKFAPAKVEYSTTTGVVEIEFRSTEETNAEREIMRQNSRYRRQILSAVPKHLGERWYNR